jgi:N-acetylneuraminate synthase
VRIGNKEIGTGHPAFIVAEIGQNHNGNLETALRMIDAAIEADVDAVKFQKRAVHLAIPEEQKSVMRDTPWGRMTYLEYREHLEFNRAQYDIIDLYCKKQGIMWFASVWDIPSFVFIKENYSVPAFKIPSACITDEELLRAMKKRDVPIIISNGMSTQAEWLAAMDILEAQGNEVLVCHCNSTYPCPPEDLNLLCVAGMAKVMLAGYSGHEVGLAPTLAAVALGACYIERHLTLDRSMWGTDQAASVEPQGFKRLVEDIRTIEKAMGDGIKVVTPAEEEVKKKLRRVQGTAYAR